MRYLVALLVAACRIQPDYGTTHYRCDNGVCPSGFTCIAGYCETSGSGDGAIDDGRGKDAPADALPGCVAQLATNQSHVCAVMAATGAVKCWGRGDTGQLGNNNPVTSPMPVTALTVTAPSAIAVGGRHTLALVGTQLYAWGFNGQSQLGDGGTVEQNAPLAISGAPTDFVSIGANARGSCGLKNGGNVECWGCVIYLPASQTAPHCMTIDTAITHVTLPATAKQLSVGGQHACALLVDNTVACFGNNGLGQLGDGTTTDNASGVRVSGLANVVAVRAGRRHSCAIVTGGDVYCWGDNGSGELGDGTTTNRTMPVQVQGLANVTQVFAAGEHTCAMSGGAAYCWGANDKGQLGDGTTTNRTMPVAVVGLTAPVYEVHGGKRFTCALDGAGVECWGWNQHGELGSLAVVDTVAHPTPAAVPLGCP